MSNLTEFLLMLVLAALLLIVAVLIETGIRRSSSGILEIPRANLFFQVLFLLVSFGIIGFAVYDRIEARRARSAPATIASQEAFSTGDTDKRVLSEDPPKWVWKRRLQFSNLARFDEVPSIMLTTQYLSMKDPGQLKYSIKALSPDRNGFDLEVQTWGPASGMQPVLGHLEVAWQATGAGVRSEPIRP